MARAAAVLFALASVACSVLDSVNGFAGPPLKGEHDAGGAAGAGDSGVCSDKDCDDGNPCNGVESCDTLGNCLKGLGPNLDDNNPCTVDYCDPVKGVQHVAGDNPSLVQCYAPTNGECAADYFRSTFACCLAQCGDCSFGVNGITCDRACAPEVEVCCGLNATDCDNAKCPDGYTKGAPVPSTCTCATDGFAVTCQR